MTFPLNALLCALTAVNRSMVVPQKVKPSITLFITVVIEGITLEYPWRSL